MPTQGRSEFPVVIVVVLFYFSFFPNNSKKNNYNVNWWPVDNWNTAEYKRLGALAPAPVLGASSAALAAHLLHKNVFDFHRSMKAVYKRHNLFRNIILLLWELVKFLEILLFVQFGAKFMITGQLSVSVGPFVQFIKVLT